jgi:DNA polymerase-3 subunit delta'
VLAHDTSNGDASSSTHFEISADDPQARQLAAGGHPDCRLVRRSFDTKVSPNRFRGSISVEDVRPLAGFLQQTSSAGGWRVAVVDAADEMTPNAANALLKMLEEPPVRTVIFLISHAPQSLLPTIRSRCRKLAISALSEEQVIEVMEPQFGDFGREDLLLLARLSQGSPGRALELAASGGAETYRALMSVLATLPDLDETKTLELADKFAGARSGDGFHTFTDLLTGWMARFVHDAALARRLGSTGDDPTGEQGAIDNVETILNLRLAGTAGLDSWLAVWDDSNKLIAQCRGLNLDRHQVTMSIFFKLAQAAKPS